MGDLHIPDGLDAPKVREYNRYKTMWGQHWQTAEPVADAAIAELLGLVAKYKWQVSRCIDQLAVEAFHCGTPEGWKESEAADLDGQWEARE